MGGAVRKYPALIGRFGRDEVIKMKGLFYNIDEWLEMVEDNRPKTEPASEGARWWLSRIKTKSWSVS